MPSRPSPHLSPDQRATACTTYRSGPPGRVASKGKQVMRVRVGSSRRLERRDIALVNHRRSLDLVASDHAIRRLEPEEIARSEILEECEVGVPVSGQDAVARRSGWRGTGDVSGSEGEVSTARSGQHEEVALLLGDAQPRQWPGVRPGPRGDLLFAAPAALPGPFQQELGQLGLGGNPQALSQERHSRQEQGRDGETPHLARLERGSAPARRRSARGHRAVGAGVPASPCSEARRTPSHGSIPPED